VRYTPPVTRDDALTRAALSASAADAGGAAAPPPDPAADPTAQLLAELELAERARQRSAAKPAARAGEAAAAEPLARSRGQALAARYWISLSLDAFEELDSETDGFYDMWGDFGDAAEDGRCPSLRALLQAPAAAGDGARREVLLVDRRTDVLLAERLRHLQSELERSGAAEGLPEARAAFLGRYVAAALGGAAGGQAEQEALAAAWAAQAEALQEAGGGCAVLRLGDLTVGLARHRALLFKALAPAARLRCRLVRGQYYCGGDEAAAAVVLVTPGGAEHSVDLLYSPGSLGTPAGFVSPAEGLGARAAEGLPREADEEAYPAFGARGGGAERAAAAARGARPRAPASSAAAGRREPPPPAPTPDPFCGDDDEESAAIAELLSAHGCTPEEAFDALMRAEYRLERAHALCQAASVLGAHVADVYQLMLLVGWDVDKVVELFMENSRAEEQRGGGGRQRAAARPAAAAAATAASGPAGWAGPPGGAAAAPAAPAAAGPTAARARTQASARVSELRARDAAAAAAASSADDYRRAFHARWGRRVAGLDLPGVLRAFGVALPGGAAPPPGAVRKAYREAVLRFHPDRQRDAELRERVEAEEAFKLITARMDTWVSA